MAAVSVRLQPTTVADLDYVLAAEQAPENACFIGQWSRDRHLQACQDPDERHWIVMETETQARAGYVILSDVQNPHQALLIKRLVITQKGKGLGRAVLEQVLHEAFLTLAAHRVWLDVLEHNHRAQSLYCKLGFVEEGLLRESFQTAEGFRSLKVMSMLRREFFNRLTVEGLNETASMP